MTSPLDKFVPHDLWAIVELLLPPHRAHSTAADARTIPDRNCFAAVVFMARTPTAPARWS